MPFVYSHYIDGDKLFWQCCLNTYGKAPKKCAPCLQCKAYKIKNGERCKLKTCLDEYCYHHLSSPFFLHPNDKKGDEIEIGLRIKKSTIPGAGYGLFATKTFKKGEEITSIRFKRITKTQLEKLYKKDMAPYTFKITKKTDRLSGDSACVRNAPSYANDKKDKKKSNCIFRVWRENNKTFASLYTTKVIRGSREKPVELFYFYGDEYWGDHDSSNKSNTRRVKVGTKSHSGPLGKVVFKK